MSQIFYNMVLMGRRCLELQQLDGDGVGPARGPPRRLPHLLPVLIHPEVAPQPPPHKKINFI